MPLRDSIRRSVQSGRQHDTPDSSDTRRGRLLQSAASVERELWVVVVCAMLLDVTLTVYGLQIGLVERNPIARQTLHTIGIFGLYGLKLFALGVGACCRLAVYDRYGPIVPIGLGIPTVGAVCINSVLILAVHL